MNNTSETHRNAISSMLHSFKELFSNDIGIDLGTATTLVYIKGEGIVLREPSVVAISMDTDNVLAVGEEAKRMVGRTPAKIHAIRPMRHGVITDFRITEAMIRYFVNKVKSKHSFIRPRIVIAIPSGTTPVERRAVKEAAANAGAREVYLMEEPMAASIGADLPIQEATGNMIVDIGGGTTEVAVISLGAIVHAESIRVAGDELDLSIIDYVKKKYNLAIGEPTAEKIKINIGSAYDTGEAKDIEVSGLSIGTQLPQTITVTSTDIREAIQDKVAEIVKAVKKTLEETPPELAADLIDNGIILSGGTSMLSGLDKLLNQETMLPVKHASDPQACVAKGTGKVLEEIELLRQLFI